MSGDRKIKQVYRLHVIKYMFNIGFLNSNTYLCKREERSRVSFKVINVKHSFRTWNFILLKIVIQTCTWTPKNDIKTAHEILL